MPCTTSLPARVPTRTHDRERRKVHTYWYMEDAIHAHVLAQLMAGPGHNYWYMEDNRRPQPSQGFHPA